MAIEIYVINFQAHQHSRLRAVTDGVTIGDNVTIGAGSVVTKDIPSNVVAVV